MRDEMVAECVKRGMPSDMAGRMTDAELEIIHKMDKGQSNSMDPGENGGGSQYMWDDQKDKPTPEDTDGAKQFWEKHKQMSEHCARMKEYGTKKYGEFNMAHPGVIPGPAAKVFSEEEMQAKVDEAVKKATVATFSEDKLKAMVDAAVAGIKSEFEPIRKDVSDFKVSAKRDAIQAFCEKHVIEGRLPSSALDRGNGKMNKVDELMLLDARVVVHKFSEGGKEVEQTALDVAKANIESGPVVYKFNENKVKQKDGKPIEPAEEEVEKIHKFAEDNRAVFKRVGTTTDEIVSAFKIKQKANPDLTAEEYLNSVNGGRREPITVE